MPADDLAVTSGDTLRRGFRVIWTGICDEPGMFGIAAAGAAVYGAGTAAGGWVLGRVTNDILAPAFAAGRITSGQALAAGGWIALVAVITAVGVVVRRVFAGVTIYRLNARYRRAVTRQYLRLPLSWHHRHPTGQLLSNANADVEASWQVFQPLPMSLGVLIMLVVAAVAMVAADPVLAAIGLLVLPAVLAVNAVYQRYMSPLVTVAQSLRADVSAIAHESFEGALVIKTLGREQAEADRFARSAHALRDANVAVGTMRGSFDPVIDAVPTLGMLAVLAAGAARVASGDASVGDVVQVAYVLSLVAFPIRALGWVLGELPRAVVGWDRVASVLQAAGGMTYGTAPAQTEGGAALRVEQLGYAYPAAEADAVDYPVLHDVSFELPPGGTVALVGSTGAGKSTLAGLLARLVDPASGRIVLDGMDLTAYRPGAVAASVALVPQGTFIFDDTVRDNVTLGADLADDEVWRALRIAQADGFVSALPHGLDTPVGERGTTLSGGQRQRLALARALVRRPRLLVLDDATSAVDPRVEADILAGLREEGAGITVLVVASRMATIALAQEVLYLEAGRLAAQGSHADLLESSQGYRHLVTAYERDAVHSADLAHDQHSADLAHDQHRADLAQGLRR